MPFDMQGYASFRMIATDENQMLNRLRNSGFSVHNIHMEKGVICGEVHWYSLDELRELAAKNSAQLEIVRKRGLIFTALKYKKRLGLAVGALLSIALIYFFSNTVLRIEVYGNENISDKQIISVLKDYGITVGKYIPSLDLRRCEKRILTALDDFSWIGIRASGCRILVQVSERTEIPEMNAVSVPRNIISAKDAQIVDIKNVRMGMLVPMLYDGVKKGDLLISGTVDGKLDHDYYVHAMGEIIGRYDEKVAFTQKYCESVREYGESFERKSLYLFGLKIPLYLNKKVDSAYDYSEYLEFAEAFGLELPVGILHSEYKTYEVRENVYSPEEVKAILEEKSARYEKNFYDGEDIVIVDKKTTLYETEEGITAEITYTLEGDIGVPQLIMAKY